MKLKKISNYVILGVITLIFLVAGLQKVFGIDEMTHNMSELNMGGWKMFAIGFLEVLGVIGLWIKRTKLLSLFGLYSFAVGALAMHLTHNQDFLNHSVESTLMVLLIPIALMLDERFRRTIIEKV